MYSLSLSQMSAIEGGKVTVGDVVNGVCYVVAGVNILGGIAAKIGLITISPVAAAIIGVVDLGCTIYYIAS